MKKMSRFFAFVLSLIMVAALFSGCGAAEKTADTKAPAAEEKAPAETKAPAAEKLRIGLSLPTQSAERWVRDKAKIEELCKEKGIELAVQVANEDAGKQDAQCENLISQGIKILVLAPHDAKSAAAIVEKAHKAGVKVISYDRLVMDSDVDLYISFDNEKVGEIQGKYITEKVAKGNFVVLAGDSKDNNATLFKKGAMKFIQPLVDKGDIKVVMDQSVKDWQPSEAMKLMENALTANKNDIQAVLAPNDGTAGGCVEAMAAQGLAGKIPITGQDGELAAAQRIVQGTQSMTVFKDTRALAEAAIGAAVKMASGGDAGANNKVNNNKIDVPSLLLTPVAIDKENIDREMIDSGYLKKEDVYKK